MEENKLYDLQNEALRLNRFVCEITLDSVQIDSRVVRGFWEERNSDTLYVNIASYENTDYEWLIDKAYNEKIGGKLTVKWLSPSLEVVKIAKYELLWVSGIFYPEYKYGVDGVASTKVGFKYADKHVEYFRRGKNDSATISENDKAFLKASKGMLEDAKRCVEDKYADYKNAEGTKNFIIEQINMAEMENDEFAKQVGCSDTDIENAKYKEPNELEVEKYNRYLKKKNEKVKTTFDFGDFNTALEWYKHHIIPYGMRYFSVDIFSEVDMDIEEKTRPTVVVCSRRCGMTTHMVAWSLAKISTAMDCEVWYVANCKEEIFSILNNIPEEIKKLHFLKMNLCQSTIKNIQTNSKLRFVSINTNIPDFFCGKELPDYVIYDNMAFYSPSKLNEFMLYMELKQGTHNTTKEICVSTPSKNGSIFNFIALTALNAIYIPWYKVKPTGCRESTLWAKKMKEMLGEDNFNIELNCQIGSDEILKPNNKKNDEELHKKLNTNNSKLDKNNNCNKCNHKHAISDNSKQMSDLDKKPYIKERLADDYGYCFEDNKMNNDVDNEEIEI